MKKMSNATHRSRHGGVLDIFLSVLLTFTVFCLFLEFCVLTAREVSLAPLKDWMPVNLSQALLASELRKDGVNRFLRDFFLFFYGDFLALISKVSLKWLTDHLNGLQNSLFDVTKKNSPKKTV